MRFHVPNIKSGARMIVQSARNNLLTVSLVIAALVFVFILQDVVSGDVMRIDQTAYWFFVLKLRSAWLTPIMEGLSELANPVVVLVMASLIAMFAPGKQPGRCVFINLGCILALNLILKNLVQRPRPEGFRLVLESGYSFPSGHSMFAMGFFGLLIWMVLTYEKDKRLRLIWSLGLTGVLIMVGLSRIYLGVHYASDVIAGFAVSLIWLIFYTKIIAPLFMPDPASVDEL